MYSHQTPTQESKNPTPNGSFDKIHSLTTVRLLSSPKKDNAQLPDFCTVKNTIKVHIDDF